MPDDRTHHHEPLRRRLLLAALACPLAGIAQASAAPPPEVARAIAGARLQGSGRLSFLGMHVYDARLWVNEGFQPERFGELPLAIELEYARTLYGKLIAERSLTEMKKVGQVPEAKAEAWLAEMTRLFPDVGKGDRITGIQLPGGSARFYLNSQVRGSISDLAFAPLFFGIWLSPRSSEPRLRQALVGGTKPGG
jgi:hypothetical protein